MPDPRLPDYTHLVPTGPIVDRETDLTHTAPVEAPRAPRLLHLAGEAGHTACGLARHDLQVTDHRNVFMGARAGRLSAYRHTCDACQAQVEGTGEGAYRSRG